MRPGENTAESDTLVTVSAYGLTDRPRLRYESRPVRLDDGAETAAKDGIPAITAFCTSSKEARPLTISVLPRCGRRPSSSAQPEELKVL